MSAKYLQAKPGNLSVHEMPPVTATELKNAASDVLDKVLFHGAVAVTRHDKPRAVLLSLEQYETLTAGAQPGWLEEMRGDYHRMLDAMQAPEQKAAAERLFQATPEELGAAAVRGARRKSQ